MLIESLRMAPDGGTLGRFRFVVNCILLLHLKVVVLIVKICTVGITLKKPFNLLVPDFYI
jgi:hypothetical protein